MATPVIRVRRTNGRNLCNRLATAERQAVPHTRGSPRIHSPRIPAAMAGCVGWPDEVNNPYEGAGHSVYGRSDRTRDAVDGYLTALWVPRDGSRRAAVDP